MRSQSGLKRTATTARSLRRTMDLAASAREAGPTSLEVPQKPSTGQRQHGPAVPEACGASRAGDQQSRPRHRHPRLGLVPRHRRQLAVAPASEPSHRMTRISGVWIRPHPSSLLAQPEPGRQLVQQGPGPGASRGQSPTVKEQSPPAVRSNQRARPRCPTPGGIFSGRYQFIGPVNSTAHHRHGVIPSSRVDSRFLLVSKSHGDSRAGRSLRFEPAEETPPNQRLEWWARCPIFWHPPAHRAKEISALCNLRSGESDSRVESVDTMCSRTRLSASHKSSNWSAAEIRCGPSNNILRSEWTPGSAPELHV